MIYWVCIVNNKYMSKHLSNHIVDTIPSDASEVFSWNAEWENKKTGVKLFKTSTLEYYVSLDVENGKKEHFWPFLEAGFFDEVWQMKEALKGSSFALFQAKIPGAELEWAFFPIDTKRGAILSPVSGTSIKKSWNFIIVYKERYMGMNVFSTNGKYLWEFDDFKDFEGQSGHMLWIKDIWADDKGTLHIVTRFWTLWNAYSITKERWINGKTEILETIQ